MLWQYTWLHLCRCQFIDILWINKLTEILCLSVLLLFIYLRHWLLFWPVTQMCVFNVTHTRVVNIELKLMPKRKLWIASFFSRHFLLNRSAKALVSKRKKLLAAKIFKHNIKTKQKWTSLTWARMAWYKMSGLQYTCIILDQISYPDVGGREKIARLIL